MKTMLILAALLLPASPVKADDLLLPGLPGMQENPAAEAGEVRTQRPDAQRALAELSAELRLSAKQEERITAAMDKKSRDFDKLLKEYDQVSAEEKKWRYKGNELKYEMARISKEMPDLIRDFLDDDQRQTYDAMLAAGNKPAQPEIKKDEPQAAPGFAEEPKPARKKRPVRRRKLPRSSNAVPGSEAAAPAAPALPAAAAPPEEEPGLMMVDNEQPAVAPSAPKKRRGLRKKAASAGKESPAPETDEAAGTYP
ncbi:MAG: hypothetical protein A2X28_04800 [Elusimicrobia bacterium GWA2_56_46]|nr:MAG: hypothetical protein A2X28_04800 [Elusimicrobia bacterium GWA2_56_46]OGR56190.1 MAG: hypothetical protein A2X39_08220 [Elusimicrobia bacterium GWC2_56_31]HBB66907.1 hypothetical protein [Elusimicrobiota bacterium]HBW23033.1 hypothetical protein [Elusimicrobiota bacterium]